MAHPTRAHIDQANHALELNNIPYFWRGHEWSNMGRGEVIDDPDRPGVGVAVLYDRRTHSPVPMQKNEFHSDQMVTKRTGGMILEALRANDKV